LCSIVAHELAVPRQLLGEVIADIGVTSRRMLRIALAHHLLQMGLSRSRSSTNALQTRYPSISNVRLPEAGSI
jgi:hypothetical protein